MDDRTIQRKSQLWEIRIRWVMVIELVGTANEHLSHRRKHAPIPVLVGIGKIGSRYPAAKTQMILQGPTAIQTSDDVAQAFPVGQLSKTQGQELIVGTEGS